jgi:hypothetical protein
MQVMYPFDSLTPAWVKLGGCSQSLSEEFRVRVAGAAHVAPNRVHHCRSFVAGRIVSLWCKPVGAAHKNVGTMKLASLLETRMRG